MTDGECIENRRKWKEAVQYGRGWTAGIVFSAFKRRFGSAVRAIAMKNTVKEVAFKICAYNMLPDVSREAMTRA